MKPATPTIAAKRGIRELQLQKVNRYLPVAGIDYRETKVVAPSAETWRRRKLVVAADGQQAEQFRTLRTSVLRRLKADNRSTLAITSPTPRSGTSLIAANLAVGLALATSHTVLLVDLDLRRPALHDLFGISLQPGLTNHLFEGVPLSQCLVNPGLDRLVILPAGTPISCPSDVLLSNVVADLANELKTRYADRLVLFDLPPVLGSDDAQAFLPLVDCYLMAIRAGITRKDDLERAVEVLGGTLLGTVLNS
jgi:capsular exopolysaccharide synthesis family protein